MSPGRAITGREVGTAALAATTRQTILFYLSHVDIGIFFVHTGSPFSIVRYCCYTAQMPTSIKSPLWSTAVSSA
jgi:hypothetical protein